MYIVYSKISQAFIFTYHLEISQCYFMNLTNNRVWDYVGDNFAH